MDSREVMSLWVDRFSAEMHTIERRAACTVRYVSFGTCNRTGKEREATTIWQVCSQQGGGAALFCPNTTGTPYITSHGLER